jgi:hypothetical protein
MLYHTRQPTKILAAIGLAVTMGLLSCQSERPTEPTVIGISAAKGGGGGRGPAVAVDEAVPPIASQNTTLDVRVLGSGFDDGSAATFKINGSAVSQVRTNSTTFVTAEELEANITVDADAPLDFYDIEVVTTRGKKGIGADLLKVVKEGSLFDATFRDDPADGMVSDGNESYDVELDVYFTLDARAPRAGRRGNVRKLCFNFHGQLEPAQVGFSDQPNAEVLCDDGWLTTGVENFLEDNQTEGVALSEMAVGAIQRSRLGGFYVREGFNWIVTWGKDCDNNPIPADRAFITRVSGAVWTIDATTMTLCKLAVKGPKKDDGEVASGLVMPVKITLTERTP